MIFHNAVKKSGYWLKFGVNQVLVMYHCRNIEFYFIFSHFSHFFLAKNGSFWSGYSSWVPLIFHDTVEKCRFCLKWGVNQLLVMHYWQDIGFPTLLSYLSHFLAKNGCFWSGYLSWIFLIFRNVKEKCRIWLQWGVYQLLLTYQCRNIEFSFIFSHFSHFLAKNGCFWSRYLSWLLLIFHNTVKEYQFWLKWGVNQLLVTY